VGGAKANKTCTVTISNRSVSLRPSMTCGRSKGKQDTEQRNAWSNANETIKLACYMPHTRASKPRCGVVSNTCRCLALPRLHALHRRTWREGKSTYATSAALRRPSPPPPLPPTPRPPPPCHTLRHHPRCPRPPPPHRDALVWGTGGVARLVGVLQERGRRWVRRVHGGGRR
jgi:hypothetical protein